VNNNNYIENDRFSAGKKAAIIGVVAPVQSGSRTKWAEAPLFEAAAVLFGNVPRAVWYSQKERSKAVT